MGGALRAQGSGRGGKCGGVRVLSFATLPSSRGCSADELGLGLGLGLANRPEAAALTNFLFPLSSFTFPAAAQAWATWAGWVTWVGWAMKARGR